MVSIGTAGVASRLGPPSARCNVLGEKLGARGRRVSKGLTSGDANRRDSRCPARNPLGGREAGTGAFRKIAGPVYRSPPPVGQRRGAFPTRPSPFRRTNRLPPATAGPSVNSLPHAKARPYQFHSRRASAVAGCGLLNALRTLR